MVFVAWKLVAEISLPDKTSPETSSLTFNRRMPNCTTVVQTASDLFEREIQLNSPKK